LNQSGFPMKPSLRHWKKPYATACSTNRLRPRVFVTMCSRSIRKTNKALVVLLLALTDRFGKGYTVGILQAEEVLSRLRDVYEQAYYAGVICERRAKAQLRQGHPGAGHDAYELLLDAMSWYKQAETLRPPKNDDALLRWNTCARLILSNQLTRRTEERVELPLE